MCWKQLTIDAMGPTLAELDLDRAVVLMQGPEAAIAAAFAAIGRTPVYVTDTDDVRTTSAPATVEAVPFEKIGWSEYTDALTLQGPPYRLTYTLAGAYGLGIVKGHNTTGPTLTGQIGYRVDATVSLGLHASIGTLDGTYDAGRFGKFIEDLVPIEVVPVTVGGFVQSTAYDRVWASLAVGLHIDRVKDNTDEPAWYPSLGFGLQGGVDVIKYSSHRLGAYAHLEGELLSDVYFSAFTAGIAVRR